jgi:hypothetical protein
MASPKLLQVSVTQDKIDALKQKLSLAQFPDGLEALGWDLASRLLDI